METGGRFHPEFSDLMRRFVADVVGHGVEYKDWSEEQRAEYSRHLQSLITSVSVAVTKSTSLAILHLANACRKRQAKPPANIAAPAAAPGAAAAAAAVGGGVAGAHAT